jgi:hypothetical protein
LPWSHRARLPGTKPNSRERLEEEEEEEEKETPKFF